MSKEKECDYYLCGNCLINSGTKKAWTTQCKGLCDKFEPEMKPPIPEKTCLNCGWFKVNCEPTPQFYACKNWQPKEQSTKKIEELNLDLEHSRSHHKMIENKLNEVIKELNSLKEEK